MALDANVAKVDVSIEMLRHNTGPRCLTDGCQLGFACNVFDVAMTAFALHLFPDPLAGDKESARVLRPGGIFAAAFGAPSPSERRAFYMERLTRVATERLCHHEAAPS